MNYPERDINNKKIRMKDHERDIHNKKRNNNVHVSQNNHDFNFGNVKIEMTAKRSYPHKN